MSEFIARIKFTTATEYGPQDVINYLENPGEFSSDGIDIELLELDVAEPLVGLDKEEPLPVAHHYSPGCDCPVCREDIR